MADTNLQDIYTLQIRRQTTTAPASPFCEACKNGYLHVNSLQVRQFTQTGKLPGVCKACNIAFLRICRLQIRHLTANEHQPHVCHVCGKAFTHAGNFRKHQLLHESGKDSNQTKDAPPKPPFPCEKCGRSFLKYGSFMKHLHNHELEEKRFPCTECDLGFKTKAMLKTHSLKIHAVSPGNTTTDMHVCKLCKIGFAKPEALCDHLLEHVAENQNSINPKTEDGNATSEKDSTAENDGEVEESDKFKHFCSVCNKGFVNLGALKNHFSVHTGDLAFECRKCKRRFMHAFNLKKHAKSHIKIKMKSFIRIKKDYSCKKCDRNFKSLKAMKIHAAVHKKKRKQQLCQKSGLKVKIKEDKIMKLI